MQVFVFFLLLAGVIAPIILINLRGRDVARENEPIGHARKLIATTPEGRRNIQAKNRMTPRDWFILGLRLFGVWELLYGLSDAVTTSLIVLHLFRPSATGGADYYMSLTFMHLIAAFYLLKFAPQTASFFYPPAEPPDRPANPKG